MHPRRPFNPRGGDGGNDSGAESTGNDSNNATEGFRRTIYRSNGTDRASGQINAEQTRAAGASSSEGNSNNPRRELRRMPAYSDLRPLINSRGGDRGNDSGASSSEGNPNNPRPRLRRMPAHSDLRPIINPRGGDRGNDAGASSSERTQRRVHWADNLHPQSGRGTNLDHSGEEQTGVPDDNWHLQGRGGPPAYENAISDPPAYENTSAAPPNSRESDRRQQGE